MEQVWFSGSERRFLLFLQKTGKGRWFYFNPIFLFSDWKRSPFSKSGGHIYAFMVSVDGQWSEVILPSCSLWLIGTIQGLNNSSILRFGTSQKLFSVNFFRQLLIFGAMITLPNCHLFSFFMGSI